MNVRKLVTIAVMTSIAIVLSIVESFIPFPIPGVRLGLANIVTLIVLYMYSYKEAVLVQLVRVILVGLIYTGLFSQAFLLSLAGSILSLIVMVSLKLIGRSSIVTISSFSAIFHSLGQIILSSILSSTWGVFLYLPLLSLISILTGVINAVIAIYVLKSFKIEVTKVSIASSITLSIMLVASLTTFIVFKSYKNKDNSLAHITYNNELIMSINLDEPTKFKVYDNGETYKGVSKDGSSYLFTYYVYNKDEKAYYNLVVEVIDSKIRIKEETSSKHICSKMGYISNKYESLVCLPNSFVITIENLNNQELDNVM